MTVTASTDPGHIDHHGGVVELSLGDRVQPFLLLGSIAVGLGLAHVAPTLAQSLSTVVSAGVFVLIYLVMVGIDARQVVRTITQRRFLAVSIALNFVVNPLVAWGLSATLLRDEPDLRIGLILFLVTPCVGWYLIFTELAGGDTSLGVGLLGVNIVLQVLLLPAYLFIFSGTSGSVDVTTVVSSVLVFLVAPAVAAQVTQRAAERRRVPLSTSLERLRLPVLKLVTLSVVIVAMFASQGAILFDNPTTVFKLVAPLTIFFAGAFLLALAAGRLFGLPYDQTALLAFTTTSRNSEASLAIAATAFTSPLVGLTVVIGPIIELPLLVVMVRVLLHVRARADSASR